MTTRDRPEPSDDAPPSAATKPPSRLPMIGATVAVLALGALGLSQCGWVQKARLDREVDRLCAIDGGVRVYETVTLPKENFGPDGEVFPQYRSEVVSGGGLGPNYRWETTTAAIVAGDPSLTRWEQRITRVVDLKLLAQRVTYVRGGGEFPGPAAPSSHSCRGVPLDLAPHVFVKENSK